MKLVKCNKSEADEAECFRCHAIITPSVYWTLRQTVWLHYSGSCGSTKYEFRRYAE